ncbi:hypothetical protein BGX26_002865, partial [Mortierella sp. AD094]
FRCSWPRCGKEFTVESRLSTHYRVHSGKPLYLCGYPGCNKAFHTSSSLSHHRVVHTDQNLRPFVCRHDRCGATYTQLARLITHQRTTHSQEASSSTSRSVSSPSDTSGKVSDDCDDFPDQRVFATELRVLLRAPVESPRPLFDQPNESLHSTNTIISQDRQQVQHHDEGYEQVQGETDESWDMILRREAAITMASLREQGAISDHGHTYSTTKHGY